MAMDIEESGYKFCTLHQDTNKVDRPRLEDDNSDSGLVNVPPVEDREEVENMEQDVESDVHQTGLRQRRTRPDHTNLESEPETLMVDELGKGTVNRSALTPKRTAIVTSKVDLDPEVVSPCVKLRASFVLLLLILYPFASLALNQIHPRGLSFVLA